MTTSHVNPSFLHSEQTDRIIGGFYETYDELGFGFLEENYKSALEMVLREYGLEVAREVPIDVMFRGASVGRYRMDMVVNDTIVVEVKSDKALTVADERQLVNYLKATKYEVGLLLHFGPSPKPRRFVFTNDQKRR